MFKQITIWIVLPLFAGIAIYSLTRPEPTALAPIFKHRVLKLPEWITYNLPDGLWLFALLNCYRLIWGTENKIQNIFWAMITTILAVSTEFLQLFRIIPGTFDKFDIFAYFFAFGITYLLFFNNNFNIKNKFYEKN